MKRQSAAVLAIFLAVSAVALVISARQQAHQFSAEECLLCHTGAMGGRGDLRPDVTAACAACHPSARNYQAHPTDLVPKIPLPGDMLLVAGRFTCVSCHAVHADGGTAGRFLRRNVVGKPFCLICHNVDNRGHLFIGATHGGQFQARDAGLRVDAMSLLCIECHSERIDSLDRGPGAESYNLLTGRRKHPIGISYRDAQRRRPNLFVPPEMLNEGIELFDGKIGCGTCHNRFSKKRALLVRSNAGSGLCLSCHIK